MDYTNVDDVYADDVNVCDGYARFMNVSNFTWQTWATNGTAWKDWVGWNGVYSDTSASATTSVNLGQTWGSWNQTIFYPAFTAVTSEESARRSLARREREALAHGERVAAEAKAKKILTEHLTEAQARDLEERGFFLVEVGSNRRRYRVERKAQHNVYLLDEKGKVTREFCTVLRDCPLEDQLLLQKLYLESDEKGFYEAANVWDHRDGLRVHEGVRGDEKINRLRSVIAPEERGILLPG